MWKDPEVYQDAANKYRWRIEPDDGRSIVYSIYSPESYGTEEEAEESLRALFNDTVYSLKEKE